jgi:hypothetical protein
MSPKNRDYVYLHVPVEKQDTGAYDEGYYYDFCEICHETTEHEDEICCDCNGQWSEEY